MQATQLLCLTNAGAWFDSVFNIATTNINNSKLDAAAKILPAGAA